MNENKRISIPLGENNLVVEVYETSPNFVPEICVFIENNNGIMVQDICVAREHCRFDKTIADFRKDPDFVDVLVWGDGDDEDYTNKFTISVYSEDE